MGQKRQGEKKLAYQELVEAFQGKSADLLYWAVGDFTPPSQFGGIAPSRL